MTQLAATPVGAAMRALPGPRSAVVDRTLRDAVRIIAESHEMNADDAVGAISELLDRQDLTSDAMGDILAGASPAHWAEFFSYGFGDVWWGPAEALPGPRTGAAEAYLRMTVASLMRLFGVGEDEAVGRTLRVFAAADLTNDLTVSLICHEEPDYWANNAYYGDVHWWRMAPEELTPLPYP